MCVEEADEWVPVIRKALASNPIFNEETLETSANLFKELSNPVGVALVILQMIDLQRPSSDLDGYV